MHARSPAGSPRRAWASTSAAAASWPSRCAPASRRERIAFHGNNKSRRRARRGARRGRRPRRGRLLRRDRPARRAWPRARRRAPVHGPGHRRRRGAHPRVHRDRPRGPEVRLLARRRTRRAEAVAARPRAAAALDAGRACTATSARQIFDTARVRGRRAPGGRPRPQLRRRARRRARRSSTSAAGFGIAYTTERRPARRPSELAEQLRAIVAARVRRATALAVPRLAVEPGRAIAGPGTVTLYEVGTVKDVDARRRARAHATSASTAG